MQVLITISVLLICVIGANASICQKSQFLDKEGCCKNCTLCKNPGREYILRRCSKNSDTKCGAKSDLSRAINGEYSAKSEISLDSSSTTTERFKELQRDKSESLLSNKGHGNFKMDKLSDDKGEKEFHHYALTFKGDEDNNVDEDGRDMDDGNDDVDDSDNEELDDEINDELDDGVLKNEIDANNADNTLKTGSNSHLLAGKMLETPEKFDAGKIGSYLKKDLTLEEDEKLKLFFKIHDELHKHETKSEASNLPKIAETKFIINGIDGNDGDGVNRGSEWLPFIKPHYSNHRMYLDILGDDELEKAKSRTSNHGPNDINLEDAFDSLRDKMGLVKTSESNATDYNENGYEDEDDEDDIYDQDVISDRDEDNIDDYLQKDNCTNLLDDNDIVEEAYAFNNSREQLLFIAMLSASLLFFIVLSLGLLYVAKCNSYKKFEVDVEDSIRTTLMHSTGYEHEDIISVNSHVALLKEKN